MTSYVANIEMFMKNTTVGELMHFWPGDEVCPEHFSKFWAKISDDSKTYTLEKLNQLRKKLCSILRLSEVLFNLVWIEASRSFFAVWLIPNEVVSEVKESFIQITMDKNHHILMIVLDEMLVYYSNKVSRMITSFDL